MNVDVVFREPWNFARYYKCLCSCYNVQLLFFNIISARIEKFYMVEKVYHANPTCEYWKFEIIRKFAWLMWSLWVRNSLFTYSFQIQFGILVIHFMNPIFFYDCAWPKTLSIISVIQNLFMFILFLDFYIKKYGRKNQNQWNSFFFPDWIKNFNHYYNSFFANRRNRLFGFTCLGRAFWIVFLIFRLTIFFNSWRFLSSYPSPFTTSAIPSDGVNNESPSER